MHHLLSDQTHLLQLELSTENVTVFVCPGSALRINYQEFKCRMLQIDLRQEGFYSR